MSDEASNPKHPSPSNDQNPNGRNSPKTPNVLVIEIWGLDIILNLGLDDWNLRHMSSGQRVFLRAKP
jgi:hypothetical protein